MLASLAAACAAGPAPDPPPLPPEPLDLRVPIPPPECLRVVRLEVDKSDRRLRASCEGGRVVELPVAVGRESEGAKRETGDLRTPEGTYRISDRARRSRFHLFIPIDYPSPDDARRAREEGRLSERDFRRILDAHEAGDAPPPDTPLGGWIGLHGEGRRWRGDSLHFDWTTGCIALSDEDVEFLAERLVVGTPIEIRR